MYTSSGLKKNGKVIKTSNLDKMLAQLCVLDKNLDKKKTVPVKGIKEKHRKHGRNNFKEDAKDDEEKPGKRKQISQPAGAVLNTTSDKQETDKSLNFLNGNNKACNSGSQTQILYRKQKSENRNFQSGVSPSIRYDEISLVEDMFCTQDNGLSANHKDVSPTGDYYKLEETASSSSSETQRKTCQTKHTVDPIAANQRKEGKKMRKTSSKLRRQHNKDKLPRKDSLPKRGTSSHRDNKTFDNEKFGKANDKYCPAAHGLTENDNHSYLQRKANVKDESTHSSESMFRTPHKDKTNFSNDKHAGRSSRARKKTDEDPVKTFDLQQIWRRKFLKSNENEVEKHIATRRLTEGFEATSVLQRFTKTEKIKLRAGNHKATVIDNPENRRSRSNAKDTRHGKADVSSNEKETCDKNDVLCIVRPEIRESKPKYQYRRSSKSKNEQKKPLKSVSTDTASSCYSSGSSQSSTSHHSQSFTDQSSVERACGKEAGKLNNNLARSSSFENNIGWSKRKLEKALTRKMQARPKQFRTTSSSSSCQIRDVNVKRKQQGNASDSFGQRDNGEDFSPLPSPIGKTFEPKFGERRTRPSHKCIVAEGEGGRNLWQHQKLVESQIPDEDASKNAAHQHFHYSKRFNNLQPKKSTEETLTSGFEKRSLTIRSLYSLHNVLSDSQNGTVISGYRRSDGMRVAIKRISKSATTRWGWLGRKVVPLELSLLCQVNRIRCEGVIDVIEWHETSEAFLLVMVRPHPAVDLYDYVRKHKRIKEAQAKRVLRQLTTALQHCISLGVLHRDVKLENILLNPNSMEITLIDFGCGDYVQSGPYKEFAGTPEYYPPEWFSRKQYDGEAMTAWSIGVLLYSLLCGALPFRSAKEILEKEATRFPSDVSRCGRDIVALLLRKNPTERLGLNSISSHPWMNVSDLKHGESFSS